jgi:hypothetical protein
MGVDGEVVQEAASFCRPPPRLPDPSSHHRPRHRHRHIRRPSNTAPAMSALSRSVASKVLTPAVRPCSVGALAPRYRAYSTNEPNSKTTSEDAPAVKLTSDSTQIRKENAAEGMRHQPDYNVAVDYRTSYVSSNMF